MLQLTFILVFFLHITPPVENQEPPSTVQPLQFSPSPANFGAVTETQKKYITITVYNPGAVDYPISATRVTRNVNTSFFVASTTCGATISAGASCTVQAGFEPFSQGPDKAALLVISSNGAGYQYDGLFGRGIR